MSQLFSHLTLGGEFIGLSLLDWRLYEITNSRGLTIRLNEPFGLQFPLVDWFLSVSEK